MTDPQSMAAQRQKWRTYFEQIIVGSDAEIEAATEGAMQAIRQRADQAGVVAAGRTAAAEFRANGQRPHAAPPPPPPQASFSFAPPPSAPQPAARVTAPGSGVVTGLQQRQEMVGRSYFQVWNFRLERRDAGGSTLPPVPVELRARSIRGQITNGDLLEIPSSSRPMRLKNLTTGATVKAHGKPHPFLRGVGTTIFLIIFVLVVLFILANFLHLVGNS